MYARYALASGLELAIVPRTAHRIKRDLPSDHPERHGFRWCLERETQGTPWSFGAYVDDDLVAYSVGAITFDGRACHGLVERVRSGPYPGAGTITFGHDAIALSEREDVKLWIVDAANDHILSLLNKYPSSGRFQRSERFEIPLERGRDRKTLRKRMNRVVKKYARIIE